MRNRLLIILASVAMLLLAGRASAYVALPRAVRDHRIGVGEYKFGFADVGWKGSGTVLYTVLDAGPIGEVQVPFSARVGTTLAIAGFTCLSLAISYVARRYWRRRRRRRKGGEPRGFELSKKTN